MSFCTELHCVLCDSTLSNPVVKLLNRFNLVQVSDTTVMPQRTKAGYKKIKITIKRFVYNF